MQRLFKKMGVNTSEVTDGNVDMVYANVSIENKSMMFNAFFIRMVIYLH